MVLDLRKSDSPDFGVTSGDTKCTSPLCGVLAVVSETRRPSSEPLSSESEGAEAEGASACCMAYGAVGPAISAHLLDVCAVFCHWLVVHKPTVSTKLEFCVQ